MGSILWNPAIVPSLRRGNWRSLRPVLDREKCVKCGTCYIMCPDMCYDQQDEEGYYLVNLFYCKGCGICAAVCPKNAIEMVIEEV